MRKHPKTPAGSLVQWAERGSYGEDNVLAFINNLIGQPVQFSPARRCIFLLDDYSAHLGDDVKKALYNKGYLLRIIAGGITGDVK